MATAERDDGWLDDLKPAVPCRERWEDMPGDDRRRLCETCTLHVWNLSDMTRPEAEALVRDHSERGERLCVRLLRRPDGTVITRNCPPAIRRAARRVAAVAAAVLAVLTLPAVAWARAPVGGLAQDLRVATTELWDTMFRRPAPSYPDDCRPTMGDIAIPEEMLGRMATPPEDAPPAPEER